MFDEVLGLVDAAHTSVPYERGRHNTRRFKGTELQGARRDEWIQIFSGWVDPMQDFSSCRMPRVKYPCKIGGLLPFPKNLLFLLFSPFSPVSATFGISQEILELR